MKIFNFLFRVILGIIAEAIMLMWFGIVYILSFIMDVYFSIRYGTGMEGFRESDERLGELTVTSFKCIWEIIKGNYEAAEKLKDDLN